MAIMRFVLAKAQREQELTNKEGNVYENNNTTR